MIWDAQSLFEPLAGTAITASGTSSNIIDLGVSGGLSAGAIRGGRVLAQIGQAFNNLTSLNVALQGAPDNGSGSPGTFKTLIETGAIPLSSLITGLALDVPHQFILNETIRNLYFHVPMWMGMRPHRFGNANVSWPSPP